MIDAEQFVAPPRLTFRQIWRQPLPYQADQAATRLMLRFVTLFARRHVVDIQGNPRHVAPDREPFIAVFHHHQRYEALLVPTLLFFYRQGKPIHFLADWPFLPMPVIASMYRRSQTIIVTSKPARPAFLNFFKPLFTQRGSAFNRALARLHGGAPVGMFPEGTINRDPRHLLRGLSGAARLSLHSGAPVVPIGIRFPGHDSAEPIPDGAPMSLWVGDPIHPLDSVEGPETDPVAALHERIMTALTRLSGKSWSPDAQIRRNYVS